MARTQTTSTGRKPTYRLYRVNGDGENANWTPIGAAWLHQDGKGLSITCDAIPLQGRLVAREYTERAPVAGGQQ